MIIDLYTACWDNADILPFFFRHYDPIVRRYVVLDDGSTDGSLDILRSHPRVEIRAMPRATGDDPRTTAALPIAETMWRETSADADWVMICETDEHLYHPDLPSYLQRCKDDGITIIPALGYQMLSDFLPDDGLLCEQVTKGAPFRQMSKMNVFNPRAIERLNYAPGRHTASPVGNIVAPDRDELLLLHFKYMDFERVMRRHQASAARLKAEDIRIGWAHRWRFTREQLRKDWDEFEAQSVDVRTQREPWLSHDEPRWWDAYRRSSQKSALETPDLGAL